MKRQFKLFLTALMFFTRIPVSKNLGYSEENLNSCNRYFPIVGMLVGAIGAFVFMGFQFLLPKTIAIIASMIATIITTGAFHEDGFADICDAFGGGWTQEQILRIMKDSRVGAYGVIGMILLLLSKFFLLFELPAGMIIVILISGHAISRSMSVVTMFSLPYVREDELSKSKPVTKNLNRKDLYISFLFGVCSLLLLGNWMFYIVLIPLLLTVYFLNAYFKKWIGGYTGDCLGTVQQVSEIIYYLSVLALLKYV